MNVRYSNILVERNGAALTWSDKVPVTLSYNAQSPVGWAVLHAAPTGDIFADLELIENEDYGQYFPGICWMYNEGKDAFTEAGAPKGEVCMIGLGENHVDDSIKPLKAYLAD